MQPLILSIETSGRLCSVALSRGEALLSHIESGEEYDHSSVLAPRIQDLLREHSLQPADLSAVAVSAGPGSYTGLRVGASMAKAMCFALGIPLIGIDTLESLALEAMHQTRIDGKYFANIDARRMEVYLASFDPDGRRLSGTSAVVLDQDFVKRMSDEANRVVFCGSGTSKASALLQSENITSLALEPKAEYVARVALNMFKTGKFTDVASFKPDYVKAPNITKPATKHL